MTSEVQLRVNGVDYSGWKSVRIARSIEQIASSVELGVTDTDPDTLKELRPIQPGDSFELRVADLFQRNGRVVMAGFIDDREASQTKDSHELRVSGRSYTGQLVDCAAIHKTGQWINRTMKQIAEDLCKPFDILVFVRTDVGSPIPEWKIEPSESVFSCLERLARDRGVLLTTNDFGHLVIERAGNDSASAALINGQNILSASLIRSLRDRFSSYTVKAQRKGSDDVYGDSLSVSATAKDKNVGLDRKLIILADDQTDYAGAKRRAQWEANVRAGRATQLTVRVLGWSHADGLWQPNTLVTVQHPWLDLNSELLIKTVIFTLDEGGAITELQLTRREAFDLIPMPAPKDGELP